MSSHLSVEYHQSLIDKRRSDESSHHYFKVREEDRAAGTKFLKVKIEVELEISMAYLLLLEDNAIDTVAYYGGEELKVSFVEQLNTQYPEAVSDCLEHDAITSELWAMFIKPSSSREKLKKSESYDLARALQLNGRKKEIEAKYKVSQLWNQEYLIKHFEEMGDKLE